MAWSHCELFWELLARKSLISLGESLFFFLSASKKFAPKIRFSLSTQELSYRLLFGVDLANRHFICVKSLKNQSNSNLLLRGHRRNRQANVCFMRERSNFYRLLKALICLRSLFLRGAKGIAFNP
jgi:hypothetical protein